MLSQPRQILKKTLYAIAVIFLLLNLVTITQAYHLTHFYDQGTVKPLEEQQSGFWGTAQIALSGVKLQKLIGTQSDSAFTDVKLTTKDGLSLAGWYIRVPHSKGTIALFHGHGSEKSANLSQSNTFNEMGYSTFLVDFRAHGQSQGNTCTIGWREAEDVKLVWDYLQNSGEKNIILYGISLGAATVTRAVYEYHLAPAKIILEMPFASLPGTVEGKMRMAHLPAEPLAALLTFWGGAINGFWAFSMQPKEFVKTIQCPVLLQWGRKDKGVTQAEIQELFNNIRSSKKLVVYDNSGHENLCENEPDKWEDSIEEFLAI